MTSSFLKKLVVAFLLLFPALLPLAQADVVESGYTLTTVNIGGGNARITGSTGTLPANLIIPLQDDGGLNITEIGTGAFQNQDSITTLTLPTSLTTIGANAFRDCDNLGSVFIPASVSSIGTGAFAACDRLASIEVDSTNGAYTSVDGVLYDLVTSAGNAILLQYPAGRPGNSYAIPQTLATAEPVISIAPRAFEQAQNLLSMEFANNVVAIGANAFENAPRLARVTFDSQVTTIGNNAFSFNGTGPLAFATFLGDAPPNLGTYIFGSAPPSGFEVRYVQGRNGFSQPTWKPPNNPPDNPDFKYDSRIIQTAGMLTYRVNGSAVEILSPMPNGPAVVVIPSTIANLPVRAIAAKAFLGDTTITSVQLPTSLATIGQDAFYGCSSLNSVGLATSLNTGELNIPANITNIGIGAFGGCPLFQILTVDAANPNYAARDNVLFNKSLKKIIQYPMALADASYAILPSVTEIGERAFEDNLNLTSIEFGVAVTTIGTRAFFNNESLITLRFDRNVSSIGDQAFSTSIGGLFSAIFFGDAPNTKPGGSFGTNVFQGASPEFKVLYLGGAAGFTQPTWTVSGQTYNSSTLNQFQNFLFTTSNGTVEIQAFTGTPPGPGELAQVVPDLTTRPVPNFVGVTNDLVFGISNVPNPLALPAGYLLYDTTTDTIWEFVEYLYDSDRVISNWRWRVYNTNNARLNLNPNVSLGTTVIEQNDVGPVIYQKVANPGSSLESWIPVNFEIPDTIAGLPVTSIAAGAFANQRLLQSVVLPDSLTRLGVGAFSGCDELGTLGLVTEQRGVFIPGPVNQIGAAPFVGCQKLQSLFVHSSNPNFTAIDGVLYNKNQTNLIQYPAGKLGMEFTIPSAVTNIFESAFEGNRYLALLQTGNNLTTIGNRAFFGSQVLAQARFGKGLNSLGNSSFSSIPSLGSVIFSGNWTNNSTFFGTEVFYRASDNFVVNYYTGATGFKSPEWTISGQTYKSKTVNVIGDFQFSTANDAVTITGYLGIEGNVTIPSSLGGAAVREIGDSVFAGNDNILSVTIPSSVTTIGNRTFAEAANLSTVNFGNGLVSIGLEAFYRCDSLAEVSLPAGVISIGSGAFGDCEKVTAITVNLVNPAFSSRDGVLFNKSQSKLVQYPGGLEADSYMFPVTVTTIGERAFEGNGNLVSIEIPNTVTTIEDAVFYGSPSIVQVQLGTRVANFGDDSFAQIPVLSSAIFLGGAPLAANFGEEVFAGAAPGFKVRYYQGTSGFPTTSPSTWTISAQIYNTEFLSGEGDFTFTVANNQATITGYQGAGGFITIPTSIGGFPVRAVGNSAFEGNEFITFVTIPSTVTSIGTKAFFGNTSLQFIQIPASVVSIGDQAFGGCTELFSIDVSPSNPNYSDDGGVLFDKNRRKLLLYPIGSFGTTYSIPSTVTEIGDRAFEGNRNLVTLTIPTGVLRIGARAFYNSQSLVTVRFGTGIDFIGSEAFSGPFSVISAVYFFGKAPTTVQANAFPLPPAVFQVRYLSGSAGFPSNPLGGEWNGYTAVPFTEFGNFAFRVLPNDTIEITGYTGTAPSRGAPPQVRADFTTLPDRNRTVADQAARLALTASQVDEGENVYQTDTVTLWTVSNIVEATENQPARVEWAVVQTDGQQLNIEPGLALGSTVLVQDANGPIVWQKVSFPGSSPENWISVNFGIPNEIAGKPVTSIADGAFAGNSLLTSVVLPSSLTRIGAKAFYDCNQLGVLGAYSGVFIPASVLTIGDGAFASCGVLDSIFVHPSSPNFFTNEGVLFNKDQTSLLCYPAGRYQAIYAVPETLTTIGAQAFEGNRYLVTIELPDSVEIIGPRAFAESESLVQVTIGKSLEILGDEAFKDVLVLGSAIFNGNAPIEIGDRVFDGAADGFVIQYFQGFTGFGAFESMGYDIATLNKVGDFLFGVNGTASNETAEITGYVGTGGNVSIPPVIGQLAVRSIGEGAFLGKTNVTGVSIPNSVTEIKQGAFLGAAKMESVVFGSGLTQIAADAFKDCDALFEVEIPASVTKIEPAAFSSCDSLGAIVVALDNPVYRSTNGVVFNKSQKILYHYPAGRASTNYIVPPTVEEISPRAFEGNVYLAVVDIPETVLKIGEEAFFNSLALVSVRFGKNVQSIGDRAFAGVITPLQSSIFFGAAPTLGKNVFQGAVAAFEVRYLKGARGFPPISGELWNGYKAVFLEEIDEFEFEITSNGKVEVTGFNGLAPKIVADVSTLPEPSIIVGNRTQRLALTDLSVGTIVLQENIGLLYEYVGPGLPSSSFNWDILDTEDARLDLPPSLGLGTTVLEQSFNGLITYQKVANPGSNVSDWIVVDFEIPEFIAGFPVDSIAPNAFKDNTIIKSVVLPNSLTKLGAEAFNNCDGLQAVFIPAGVTTYGAGAFGGCDKLEALFVHSNNPRFLSSGGVLFNKTQTSLVQYPSGIQASAYKVPITVTSIAELAFDGNMFLVTLEIGNACRNIANEAFVGSQSLVSVTIGEGIKAIGEKAFADITSLTSIVFQGNAPALGSDVFFGTSPEFQVRYYPGTSGFDGETWGGVTVAPIATWQSGVFATTNGFRAVGTIDQAVFNNNLGGQIYMAVNRNGVATGSLNMVEPGGKSALYRFSAKFDEDGLLTTSIPRRGLVNLDLKLQLDLLNAPRFFRVNSASSVTDGQTTAKIHAAMVPWKNTNPAKNYGGTYTVGLDTDQKDFHNMVVNTPKVPQGNGFLSFSLTAGTGAVRAAGMLADGTRFTFSSVVLGDGGVPIWVPLYSRQGMLLGDMEIEGSDPSEKRTRPVLAELYWTKPNPVGPSSMYLYGFNNVLLTAAYGSGSFAVPSVSQFNNLKLDFSDGNWSKNAAKMTPFSQIFEVPTSSSRIVPKNPIINNTKVTWNLRSGLFQGTFVDSQKRLARFQGIMLTTQTPESPGSLLELRGNFQLPNTASKPTFFIGGKVSN